MTTKPKAKKFRIKRSLLQPAAGQTRAAAPGPGSNDISAVSGQPARQTTPQRRQSTNSVSHAAERSVAGTTAPHPAREAHRPDAEDTDPRSTPGTKLDAIRDERLTGRQLRMARRVAQKNGLSPTSDLDAVRMLRANGIDPFQRANMLELVVPQQGDDTGMAPPSRAQLPQAIPDGDDNVPSTQKLSPAQRREREISDIQRDIARRRRRKIGLLLTRLAFFVMLPTFLAGWYFYRVATPMYATDSEFLIIQNEGAGGAGPLGGLLPTQFATSQDSIAVQSYLTSKDAMLRLDEDEGFHDHFSQARIDPIQRLPDDATNEAAYKTYSKNVKIGFDPTEGVMRMEVIAANPEISQSFSDALISYAEERVN